MSEYSSTYTHVELGSKYGVTFFLLVALFIDIFTFLLMNRLLNIKILVLLCMCPFFGAVSV